VVLSYLGTALGLGLISVLLVQVGLYEPDAEYTGDDPVAAFLGLAWIFAPLWLAGLVYGYRWISSRTAGRSVSLRDPVRYLKVGLWVIVGCSAVALAVLLPRAMANGVESSDHPKSIPILSLMGLRVDGVSVSSTDGAPVAPGLISGRCVWLLGSADGVTALYDAQQDLLIRVSTDRVVTQRPCR
jgi:hypothetical protein